MQLIVKKMMNIHWQLTANDGEMFGHKFFNSHSQVFFFHYLKRKLIVSWLFIYLFVYCSVTNDTESTLCLSSGLVLAVMAPRLSVCTCSDMVWQRVCWKLLENVPQRWLESVLTGLVQAVSG